MSSVAALLSDPSVPLSRIADALAPLSADERRRALAATTRAEQRALWNKAAGAEPLRLDDFVPPGVAPRVPVAHHGRNTLPLLPSWRFFQKIFCRPADGSERLFGWNSSDTTKLIGPGYYVAIPTAGNRAWEERGAVVVDYFQVPDGPVADGWPKVVPNDAGVQRFFLAGTRDFLRRVCDGVTIGAAYKGEKALDHYFVLVREG